MRNLRKENKKKAKKPLGIIPGIISVIPMFNWMALIILGFKCSKVFSLVMGILFGIITFTLYDLAPFLWVFTLFYYFFRSISINFEYSNTYEKCTRANYNDSDYVEVMDEDDVEMYDCEDYFDEEIFVVDETQIIEEAEIVEEKPVEAIQPPKYITIDFDKIKDLRNESEIVKKSLEV